MSHIGHGRKAVTHRSTTRNVNDTPEYYGISIISVGAIIFLTTGVINEKAVQYDV